MSVVTGLDTIITRGFYILRVNYMMINLLTIQFYEY